MSLFLVSNGYNSNLNQCVHLFSTYWTSFGLEEWKLLLMSKAYIFLDGKVLKNLFSLRLIFCTFYSETHLHFFFFDPLFLHINIEKKPQTFIQRIQSNIVNSHCARYFRDELNVSRLFTPGAYRPLAAYWGIWDRRSFKVE